jgi:hypothetical protein
MASGVDGWKILVIFIFMHSFIYMTSTAVNDPLPFSTGSNMPWINDNGTVNESVVNATKLATGATSYTADTGGAREITLLSLVSETVAGIFNWISAPYVILYSSGLFGDYTAYMIPFIIVFQLLLILAAIALISGRGY